MARYWPTAARYFSTPKAVGPATYGLWQPVVQTLCTLRLTIGTSALALPRPASLNSDVLTGPSRDDVGALIVPIGQTEITAKLSEYSVAIRVSKGAVAQIRSLAVNHKEREKTFGRTKVKGPGPFVVEGHTDDGPMTLHGLVRYGQRFGYKLPAGMPVDAAGFR